MTRVCTGLSYHSRLAFSCYSYGEIRLSGLVAVWQIHKCNWDWTN